MYVCNCSFILEVLSPYAVIIPKYLHVIVRDDTANQNISEKLFFFVAFFIPALPQCNEHSPLDPR